MSGGARRGTVTPAGTARCPLSSIHEPTGQQKRTPFRFVGPSGPQAVPRWPLRPRPPQGADGNANAAGAILGPLSMP